MWSSLAGQKDAYGSIAEPASVVPWASPMVVLLCTQKLLARLKLPAVVPQGLSSTRLGDWYGNALRLSRQQLLLFVSGRTHRAAIVPARDTRRLPAVLADAVADRLAALGVPAALIDQERQYMADVVFTRTHNRSVLGTMNDYAFMARDIQARRGAGDARGVDGLLRGNAHLGTRRCAPAGPGPQCLSRLTGSNRTKISAWSRASVRHICWAARSVPARTAGSGMRCD